MALTASVKEELSRLDIKKSSVRKAEVSAMLRFAGGLHIISGRIVIEAEVDLASTARRLRAAIAEVYGHQSEIIVVSGGGLRKGSPSSGGVPDHPTTLPGDPVVHSAAEEPSTIDRTIFVIAAVLTIAFADHGRIAGACRARSGARVRVG